jgi:prepilin signal peptidase PulO-like enzyme (type II secretory pathway)
MSSPDILIRTVLLVGTVAIGATIGSFLNVCIYRIPVGLTVTKPKRSFCPSCRTQIKALDNIPLISWLLLKGRCRYCRAPIPVWYFLVELFAAIGSGVAYLKSGLPGAALFLIAYSLLTYTLRTARAGYSNKPRLLVLLMILTAVLYIQREAVPGIDLWKLALCFLSAVLLMRSGYGVSVDTWTRRIATFAAVLASGWLGALVAAVILTLYRKRSADTDDAILLACVSLGPILA